MSSTTTNGRGATAGRVPDDVAGFAAAVRRSLEDLPPDEVEELVDGLEADLIEGREDSGEPLGDPVAYADELRSAAGLPPRDVRPSGEWFGGYKRLWASGSAWVEKQRGNPTVAAVLDFLVALRPVWWVLRGWAVFKTTVMFGSLALIPDTLAGQILLVGFVVVSVQWGRGRWLPWGWLRTVRTVGTVVAVLVLPFLVNDVSYQLRVSPGYVYETQEVAPESLSANGTQVTNVFAYDCAGDPISGVQLFDQNGDRLDVGDGGSDDWLITYDADGAEVALVPNPDANSGSGWNVFPLFDATFDDEEMRPDPSSFEQAAFPFGAVQPLADAEEACATGEDESVPGDGADEPDEPVIEPAPTDGGN